jgi:8-oxo-dGTP pyrophosphatase MutT (NUDIX family)
VWFVFSALFLQTPTQDIPLLNPFQTTLNKHPSKKGETFHQAAERGLKEELGIDAALPPTPAIPRHLRAIEARLPPSGDGSGSGAEEAVVLRDVEFVESYRLDGYAGGVVAVNEAEVIATRWAKLDEVRFCFFG